MSRYGERSAGDARCFRCLWVGQRASPASPRCFVPTDPAGEGAARSARRSLHVLSPGSRVHVLVLRGGARPAAAPVPPGPHVLPVPLLVPLLPEPRAVRECPVPSCRALLGGNRRGSPWRPGSRFPPSFPFSVRHAGEQSSALLRFKRKGPREEWGREAACSAGSPLCGARGRRRSERCGDGASGFGCGKAASPLPGPVGAALTRNGAAPRRHPAQSRALPSAPRSAPRSDRRLRAAL